MGAVGVPGDVWEPEWRLLEDGWIIQPRAAPWALPPFLWVPVGESDLSPKFPHLKIKDKQDTGKVVIQINCCL